MKRLEYDCDSCGATMKYKPLIELLRVNGMKKNLLTYDPNAELHFCCAGCLCDWLMKHGKAQFS